MSRLLKTWMISGIFLCLFSWSSPRTVESARSAHDAIRGEFMANSNLLDIYSIFDRPISNLVMFDPSRRCPPPGMPLTWSSDLRKAVFAASRGSTHWDKDSSLSFANSYLTSVRAIPIPVMDIPFAVCHFPLHGLVQSEESPFAFGSGYYGFDVRCIAGMGMPKRQRLPETRVFREGFSRVCVLTCH
jgi:hypothetical protein